MNDLAQYCGCRPSRDARQQPRRRISAVIGQGAREQQRSDGQSHAGDHRLAQIGLHAPPPRQRPDQHPGNGQQPQRVLEEGKGSLLEVDAPVERGIEPRHDRREERPDPGGHCEPAALADVEKQLHPCDPTLLWLSSLGHPDHRDALAQDVAVTFPAANPLAPTRIRVAVRDRGSIDPRVAADAELHVDRLWRTIAWTVPRRADPTRGGDACAVS